MSGCSVGVIVLPRNASLPFGFFPSLVYRIRSYYSLSRRNSVAIQIRVVSNVCQDSDKPFPRFLRNGPMMGYGLANDSTIAANVFAG